MWFSSSIQTNDDDLTGKRDANDPDDDFSRRTKRLAPKKHLVPELAGVKEQEEFFNKLDKESNSKQELTEFREDLSRLTLAECLQKYECSIGDALKLDPLLQKRILIKVTDRFH